MTKDSKRRGRPDVWDWDEAGKQQCPICLNKFTKSRILQHMKDRHKDWQHPGSIELLREEIQSRKEQLRRENEFILPIIDSSNLSSTATRNEDATSPVLSDLVFNATSAGKL